MENESLTIGKLAQAVGVPVSTIRYYEREGLLAPGGRSAGNYRLYGPAELEKLRVMRAAQEAGLTLGDIRSLLTYREEGGSTCREVQGLLKRRLESIDLQVAHLLRVKKTLGGWLGECHQRESSGRCAVLEDLEIQSRQS